MRDRYDRDDRYNQNQRDPERGGSSRSAAGRGDSRWQREGARSGFGSFASEGQHSGRQDRDERYRGRYERDDPSGTWRTESAVSYGDTGAIEDRDFGYGEPYYGRQREDWPRGGWERGGGDEPRPGSNRHWRGRDFPRSDDRRGGAGQGWGGSSESGRFGPGAFYPGEPDHSARSPYAEGRAWDGREHHPDRGHHHGFGGGTFGEDSRGDFSERGFGQWGSAREFGGYGGSRGERGGHYGRGPKGYLRSDDRIHEDICERLSEDPHVDASDVTITVKNGEVTLEGEIEDRRMKHRAEDIVDAVAGVRDIHNHLRPRRSFWNQVADKLTGGRQEPHGRERQGRDLNAEDAGAPAPTQGMVASGTSTAGLTPMGQRNGRT